MGAGPFAAPSRWYRARMALIGPLGTPEIIIILVVLLLLFGAKRLPEMGRSLGRGMREFKDAVTGNEPDEPEKAQITEPAPGPSTTTHDPPPRTQRGARPAKQAGGRAGLCRVGAGRGPASRRASATPTASHSSS